MESTTLSFRRDAPPSAGTDLSFRAKRSIGIVAAVVLAVYLLFFHGLDRRDLWSSHEARAAMDAQTILEDGHWGLPHLYDGRPEMQKPPLYYWLTALLAHLRGGTVDAWAVRLPAAISALLCVLAVAVGLGRLRPAAGVLAALMLATAVHFTWLARIGRIDMPLTLCVTLALGGLYLARRQERWKRGSLLLVAYLAVAAGVLFKGPIGLVLPLGVISLHLTMQLGAPTPKRWRGWWTVLGELGVWWGIPLVVVLTLPWFLWVNRATDGAFFRVFVWHHNIERGYGGSSLRSNPWWFYLPQLVGDFLPWSLLLPLAGWWCYRRGWWRIDAEARFGLCWFAGIFLILSCSRFKRADYLLPAYPGLAVFLGCIGQRWLQQLADTPRRRVVAAFAGVVGLLVAGWMVQVEQLLPAREPYRDYRAFAVEVRRRTPLPEEVLFFRTEAHALAFHVGRPLAIVIEWGELNARLRQPGTHYFVTPPNTAEECVRCLHGVRLETVLDNRTLAGGKHERPLLLLRAVRSEPSESGYAETSPVSADCLAALERDFAGSRASQSPRCDSVRLGNVSQRTGPRL